jgi:predicted nucleic acid-binding protein
VRRFVVDASALVEYLFRLPLSLAFESVIEEGEFHVPSLADLEFASAAVRLITRGLVSEHAAFRALDELSSLPLTRHGHLAFLPRVLTLRNNFSVYDAMYVALAESLNAELITADEKLAGAVLKHTKIRVTSSATRS